MKRVAVLGSTGSIGTSCLTVLETLSDRLEAVALTAHRGWESLAEQCRRFQPRWAVLADETCRDDCDLSTFPNDTEVRFGAEAIEQIAADDGVDIVITGITGAAGLRGTWAAVEAGKRVGIANKETLVVAGPLVMDLAERSGAELIPVDSEHSAIFQALQAGNRADLQRVILTASGGPFRGQSSDQLREVTPEMALAHPTWDMGPKVTIDSATLMNKALEVIEARWLFDLSVVGCSPETVVGRSPDRPTGATAGHPAGTSDGRPAVGEGAGSGDPRTTNESQIAVVVHPQSIVHSFVEFVDGSVVAQLSPPDMMLPIQYALTWPDRTPGPSPRMDWGDPFSLEFHPPDREAFPALDLGFEVAERGGTCGAVLNAANEAAVARFLESDLAFTDIARACRAVLSAHKFDPKPTLSELMRLDAWAREEINQWK